MSPAAVRPPKDQEKFLDSIRKEKADQAQKEAESSVIDNQPETQQATGDIKETVEQNGKDGNGSGKGDYFTPGHDWMEVSLTNHCLKTAEADTNPEIGTSIDSCRYYGACRSKGTSQQRRL